MSDKKDRYSFAIKVLGHNPTRQNPVMFISDGKTDWFDQGDSDDDNNDNASDPSSMYDSDGNLKPYEQAMADWDKTHPEPTAPVAQGTGTPMSYEDILAQYDAQQAANAEALAKKKRRDQNLAALTDGINAITNLVGSSQGAQQTYDPSQSLTEKMKEKYAQIAAQQAADRKTYQELAYKKASLTQKEQAAAAAADRAAQSAYQKEQAQRATERNRFAQGFRQERSYNFDQEKFANTKQQQEYQNKFNREQFEWRKKVDVAPTYNSTTNTTTGSHESLDPDGNKVTLGNSSSSTRTTVTRKRI